MFTSNYAEMTAFVETYSIAKAARADKKDHIGLHYFYVLSHLSIPGQDFLMTFAIPHMLLNLCRAYNSNFLECLRMDAAFKLNHYQV